MKMFNVGAVLVLVWGLTAGTSAQAQKGETAKPKTPLECRGLRPPHA